VTKKAWLVNVALPIEAATPAEAVGEYWRYVTELGSAELPAYVCPVDDELAMIPFVAGAPSNEDPEED
jgi:hypothetical protein